MNFGFNFGLGAGLGAYLSTNCWNPMGNSGTIYGYDSGLALGGLLPNTTSDGTFVYSYTFDTSTGEFKARFGVGGNEGLVNTKLVIYRHKTLGFVEMFWDSVNLYYSGTDMPLAAALALEVGTVDCFQSLVIPDLLIHYTYEGLEDA